MMEQKANEHFAKILKGYVEKTYRKSIFNNEIKYTAKAILTRYYKIFVNTTNKNENENRYKYIAFIKKNTPIVQRFMKNIRNTHHQYKKAKEVKKLKWHFERGVYHDKFDIERLIKYLAQSKLQASKEDMSLVFDIITIIISTLENTHKTPKEIYSIVNDDLIPHFQIISLSKDELANYTDFISKNSKK